MEKRKRNLEKIFRYLKKDSDHDSIFFLSWNERKEEADPKSRKNFFEPSCSV